MLLCIDLVALLFIIDLEHSVYHNIIPDQYRYIADKIVMFDSDRTEEIVKTEGSTRLLHVTMPTIYVPLSVYAAGAQNNFSLPKWIPWKLPLWWGYRTLEVFIEYEFSMKSMQILCFNLLLQFFTEFVLLDFFLLFFILLDILPRVFLSLPMQTILQVLGYMVGYETLDTG